MSAQASTLFVDDAPSLLRTIRGRLSEIGCKAVAVASTAEEALRIVSAGKVSHVVSDWKMSGAGGIAFLRKIRSDYPDIKCTLLTGFIHELSRAEKLDIENSGIELADKEQVSTAWLARLVGYTAYEPVSDIDEESDSANSEIVSGPADVIAEQRLKIEELERVVLYFAEDLLRELELVEMGGEGGSIVGGKSYMTVKDILREIRSLSPLGCRLIELDRAARQRIMKRRVS